MAAIIEMPKLSDTMEEGAIANWLKKEGDAVKEGDPLCEIETDKATMEYQSPESGTILKIIAQPGKAVALSSPIAVVGKAGETFDLAALMAKGAPSTGGHKEKGASAPSGSPTPAVIKVSPTAAPGASPGVPSATGAERLRASPLAKKLAGEMGVNLTSVAGSGPAGRIVMRDIEQAKGQGSGRAGSAATIRSTGEDRVIPVSMMRKTIAKRLLAGKNDAPHFYLTVSANMSEMTKWRARVNEAATEGSGVAKVSMNDLIIFAVGRALRRHPGVNASWQGDTIVEFGNVHVCMAVALPTGLVTPVIRHADQLGVRQIAEQTRSLAKRAKDGSLGNEDYAGGTFTVSNLGMLGIEEFTAIINPPQAAILAVGAAIAVPAVDSKGQVVVQSRLKMTMSCDHRVVDGAMGAEYLKTLVGFIENPLTMME